MLKMKSVSSDYWKSQLGVQLAYNIYFWLVLLEIPCQ